ncbi:MAG: MCE family protein [Methylobacteriaceae bacterium]|nr:MCE family protein [Methylobacteriaceae bacterium]
METRANYALIGAFTIAVIAAGFLFVYWFSGGAKSAQRKTYQIVFSGSVSGLSRGSYVLFNGLRVGEVTQIDLMEEDPSRVAALVEVSERTPVQSDTRARLEYQGLTGIASIALSGASAESPALPSREKDAKKAVIYAERSDFQNLLENVQNLTAKADSVLARADTLFADGAGSVKQTLRNVETFSKALADNADGVNAFLAGMSDLGKTIGPLSKKLEGLSEDVDKLVRAVDPDKVRSVVADVSTFTQTLAANKASIDSVFTDAAGLAKRLNETSQKLDNVLDLAGGAMTAFDSRKLASIVDSADGFMKTLDRNRASVDSTLKDAAELTRKLNAAADKIDGVMTSLDGFLGGASGDATKGVVADISSAARSMRKLADNLDSRTKEITAGIAKFTGPVAREYEALATEGRRAVGEINRAVRSIERNPQQFIFGGKSTIPEYSPSR